MYRLATISWAILLVGLFTPFAFGMYWKKANRLGAVASFLGGFGSWLLGVFYFYPLTARVNTANGQVAIEDAMWDAVYISCTPAVIVSILLMIGVSLATQRRNPPMPLVDVDGNPLLLNNRLGILPPREICSEPEDGLG